MRQQVRLMLGWPFALNQVIACDGDCVCGSRRRPDVQEALARRNVVSIGVSARACDSYSRQITGLVQESRAVCPASITEGEAIKLLTDGVWLIRTLTVAVVGMRRGWGA